MQSCRSRALPGKRVLRPTTGLRWERRPGNHARMIGKVERVDPLEDGHAECWERRVEPFHINYVDALRFAKPLGGWRWMVGVAAMEFVRDDPLESELRTELAARLGAVPGVTAVREEDNEAWVVSGSPSGAALVEAAAAAIDRFADRVRDEIARPKDDEALLREALKRYDPKRPFGDQELLRALGGGGPIRQRDERRD